MSCGTGSTWAWRTNHTSYRCTKDVAQVAADMTDELRQQGFVLEPNASGATVFRRELPCRAFVRLRKAAEPGETSVYVEYGYPLVTWYGRRIPPWITQLLPFGC